MWLVLILPCHFLSFLFLFFFNFKSTRRHVIVYSCIYTLLYMWIFENLLILGFENCLIGLLQESFGLDLRLDWELEIQLLKKRKLLLWFFLRLLWIEDLLKKWCSTLGCCWQVWTDYQLLIINLWCQ